MPLFTKRPETIEAHQFSEKPWPDWVKAHAPFIYTDANGKTWYNHTFEGMKEIFPDDYVTYDQAQAELNFYRKEVFERAYMQVATTEVYVEPEPVPPELERVANVLSRSCGK
jgi:hypothetical protein